MKTEPGDVKTTSSGLLLTVRIFADMAGNLYFCKMVGTIRLPAFMKGDK